MQDKNLHSDKKYTDQAWGKMKELLDQELPTQQNNKKPLIIFWAVSIGIAAMMAGIYFFTTIMTPSPEINQGNKMANSTLPVNKDNLYSNNNKEIQITTAITTNEKTDNTPNSKNSEHDIKKTENQAFTGKSNMDIKENEQTLTQLTKNHGPEQVISPSTNSTGYTAPNDNEFSDNQLVMNAEKKIEQENSYSAEGAISSLEALSIPELMVDQLIEPVFLTEKKREDIGNVLFASRLFTATSKTSGLNLGYARIIKTKNQKLNFQAGIAYNYIAQPIEYTFAEITTPGGSTSSPATQDLLYEISYAENTNLRLLASNGNYSEYANASGSDIAFNRLKLNYVSFPIQANVKKDKFKFSAGVQPGILLLANNSSLDGGVLKTFQSNDNEDLFLSNDPLSSLPDSTIPTLSNFDFAATVGLGYYLSPNIGIHLNYVHGVKDVIQHNTKNDFNRLIQLSMEYSW